MTQDTYSISELAKEAGVTVRTIRYYISQGLLPSPGMAGQGDRYDTAYLKRLQLIKRLKEEYLPLEKIRELLETLGDEAINEEVDIAPPQAAESAREYIQSILASREPVSLNQRLKSKMVYSNAPGGQPVPVHRDMEMVYLNAQTPMPVRAELPPTEETWLRYRICEDVELHVRAQPSNAEIKRRLARILRELERLCRA